MINLLDRESDGCRFKCHQWQVGRPWIKAAKPPVVVHDCKSFLITAFAKCLNVKVFDFVGKFMVELFVWKSFYLQNVVSFSLALAGL